MVTPAETTRAFVVAWTFEHRRRSIDVDSETMVATIAVALAELDRENVVISGHDYEVDAETNARIKAVSAARTRQADAFKDLEALR